MVTRTYYTKVKLLETDVDRPSAVATVVNEALGVIAGTRFFFPDKESAPLTAEGDEIPWIKITIEEELQ